VDARKGVLTQTRRHSYIARLMNIPHVVAAVNKMDLVGHDQATFERIRDEYLAFAKEVGLTDVKVLPMSALAGDMVVDRGEAMGWYEGPTLLEMLEAAPAAQEVPALHGFAVAAALPVAVQKPAAQESAPVRARTRASIAAASTVPTGSGAVRRGGAGR
jgi:sulfate adenylyltransferase subunit 1 (EFTu-like GTPase family)